MVISEPNEEEVMAKKVVWWWVRLMAWLGIYEVHYGFDRAQGDWTGMVKMARDRHGNCYVLEERVRRK